MTDEQRAYWQAYVDALKPILRLWHWQITVLDAEPSDEIAVASVMCPPMHYEAEIRLANDFFDHSPEYQRYALTHELAHLHWWWHMRFSEELACQLSAQAKELAFGRLRELMELANDETAKVIAPFLPLPPKIKREKHAA